MGKQEPSSLDSNVTVYFYEANFINCIPLLQVSIIQKSIIQMCAITALEGF